jgi:hypothetical protein
VAAISVVPSRRERLWRAIEAQLWQITVANGYEVDVRFVRRGASDALTLPAYPAVLILPDTDVPDSGPTSVNHHVLTFHLEVWVKEQDGYAESEYPQAPAGDAPSTIHAQLETVLTAVTRAMMQQPTWGGLAEHTDEQRVQYLLLDTTVALCGTHITYAIDYRTSVEDVTVPPAVLAMTASWPQP